MLNNIESSQEAPDPQPDNFQATDYSGCCENEMLGDQGFYELKLNKLRRKGVGKNEYMVFSNKDEFKAIEAETATLAMNASETATPHKIIHSYCRLDDIIELEKLEFVEKNVDSDVTIEGEVPIGDTSATAAPETGENPPPAEEPKPAENGPPAAQ